MCKDDGWFIGHVEPPNACRPSDNPTDRLAIGVCASKYVRIDPVCERVVCRPGASKSRACPQVLAGRASTLNTGRSSRPHPSANRTEAIGGRRASGIVQLSPPFSEIHRPPLVEPKA